MLNSIRTATLLLALFGHPLVAQDIVGPATKTDQGGKSLSCADCHAHETAAWKASSHWKGGRLAGDDAAEIVSALVASGKLPSKQPASQVPLCTSCHGTENSTPTSLLAGVSCESCHAPAQKWLPLHNLGSNGKPFEPRTAPEEDAEARAKRDQACTDAGMIRTSRIFDIARNCLDCHSMLRDALPDDGISSWDLIAAGHPVGSAEFELVAYSQGEVRHNFLYRDDNGEAPHGLDPAERRRALYLSGQLATLDTYLRSLAECDDESARETLLERYEFAVEVLEELQEDALESEELGSILESLPDAEDADEAKAAISGDASTSARLRALANQHANGTGLEALDDYLPEADEAKGTPYQGR